jgi:hypothetical protein
MRGTIRQLLISGVAQVEGRVYEPHAVKPETPKPFLVVREGFQDPGADWAAFSTVVEVWPYVARTTFQQVDSLAEAVVGTLHRARFSHGGEQYLADYVGTAGQDFVDEEWDAITRGLRFRVFALGWLNGLTYAPDPVAALRSWTAATWPEAQADPATWNPSDAAPGVYWRLLRVTTELTTAAVNWLQARLAGHVLVPDPAARLVWARRIAEALAVRRRLIMQDGGTLELLAVTLDGDADPMKAGQVQVTARFGALRPAAQVEVLRRAVVGGAVTGEVT